MEKKGWRGSFTVEAAVVISVSFLVLGAFILLIFIVHDTAVFQGMVCETAVAGSNFAMKTEGNEAAETVRKEINSRRFLGSRNISVTKEEGEKSTSVSAAAEYPVPGMLLRFLKEGKVKITYAWNCRIINPGKTIRAIRGTELLFQEVLK